MENKQPKLKGHFLSESLDKKISLELWLEEDGFFKLKFTEREDGGGFAINDEKGRYEVDADAPNDPKRFVLSAQSRDWTWKDNHDGDSGVDSTDLKYPCEFKSAVALDVNYLERIYNTKSV